VNMCMFLDERYKCGDFDMAVLHADTFELTLTHKIIVSVYTLCMVQEE